MKLGRTANTPETKIHFQKIGSFEAELELTR